MHICYISSYYDREFFEKSQGNSLSLNNAIQKFNGLVLQGLSAINGYNIDAISTVERGMTPSKPSVKENLGSNEISITYAWNWNKGGIRNIGILLSTFFHVLRMPKDTVVLSDVLKVSGMLGGLFAARIRKFKTVGIVTDLPDYQDIASSEKMLCLNNWAISKQDGYVLLTEAMNAKVNPLGKPYVVVEGFADENMKNRIHDNRKKEKKIVIYAGSLCAKYGICDLIEAFLKISKINEELWVFGDGDYASQVERIATNNANIKYFGRQPNSVVVNYELQATLLVNPRTSEGEYTKYSFPSKTLEYMSTGTPVLMYKLPGIPKDYDGFLEYFDNYSDMATSLRQVLDLPEDVLESMGNKAKDFVMSEKNTVKQAFKIITLIEDVSTS